MEKISFNFQLHKFIYLTIRKLFSALGQAHANLTMDNNGIYPPIHQDSNIGLGHHTLGSKHE